MTISKSSPSEHIIVKESKHMLFQLPVAKFHQNRNRLPRNPEVLKITLTKTMMKTTKSLSMAAKTMNGSAMTGGDKLPFLTRK